MKSRRFFLGKLLLSAPAAFFGITIFIGGEKAMAANATHTWTNTTAANWNAGTWSGGAPSASSAGDIVLRSATTAATVTLNVSGVVVGAIRNSAGSANNWTIQDDANHYAITLDNSGWTGAANSFGSTVNSSVNATSSGPLTVNANLVLSNTDADFGTVNANNGGLTIGVLGVNTINAAASQNRVLNIYENDTASAHILNINSDIGTSGGNLTVNNIGTGNKNTTINGSLGANVTNLNQNTVQAASILIINGANANYAGTTAIKAGTIQTNTATKLGSVVIGTATTNGTLATNSQIVTVSGLTTGAGATLGSQTINGGGTLNYAGSTSNEFDGIITGTGTKLTVSSGTLVLNGAGNSHTGVNTINGGTLNINSQFALGGANYSGLTFGASGGTLIYNSTLLNATTDVTANSVGVAKAVTFTGNATINTNGSNVTFANPVGNSGTGGFTKAGNGTLTFNNTATYSGDTTVGGGTLKFGATTSTPASAKFNIGSGAILDVSGLTSSTLSLGSGKTLTGAGSVTDTVSAGNGSFLTPGTVISGNAGSGYLTVGNLVLSSGSALNFGLSTGNALNNYLSTTALTLPGSGSISLNLYAPGTATAFASAGTYDLFQYTSISGGTPSSLFTFGTSIAGFTPSFGTAAGPGGTTYLTLTLTQAGVLASWTGGGPGTNWTTSTNWQGGNIPGAAGDSATFDNAATPGTITLDANETVGGLTFNTTSGSYTLAGANTLTLDNNGSGVSISNTGTHAIAATLALNENTSVNVAASSTLSVSGAINDGSGSHSLSKTGSGTLVLSGSNGYSGGTSINNGALDFSSLGNLGTGGISIGGGTLRYNGNTDDISVRTVTLSSGVATVDTNGSDVTFANAIGNGGNGSLNKAGNGTLSLSGTNNYTGGTAISAGTVVINNSASLGDVSGALTINNGTLQTTADIATARAMVINHANSGILVDAGTTYADTGAVSGSGTLNKTGAGTLALGGINTFNGAYSVTAGTLSFTSENATGSNVINIADTAAVTLTSAAADTVGNLNFTSGTGSFSSSNTGSNYITTGVVNVASGVTANLQLGNGGRASIVGGSGSGTLNLAVGNVNGQGDPRYELNGSWTAFSGTLNFTATTASSGARLTANGGTFNGDLSNATVNISGTSGNSMAVAGRFFTSGSMSIGALSGDTGAILQTASGSGAGTFVIGNKGLNTTFAGVIQNGATTLSITKVGSAGRLTLTGNSNYTGATLVSAGTLLVNGSLSNTSGTTVTGGKLGGTGAIASSVTLSGTATLSPGASVESLATGSLTMGSGTTFVYEAIDNSSSGGDLLAANGSLSLTGVTLDLSGSNLDLGTWLVGDKLTLISYTGAGITSGFTGFTDDTTYTGGVFGGNQWLFNYNDTAYGNNFSSEASATGTSFVTLTVVPEPASLILGSIGFLTLLRRRK